MQRPANLEIEFVNHAGFLLSSGAVRLLCDPWLEGRAFNDGWALLSPSRFGPADFARVTHLWFSHEHPDHFSPPNMKQVPAELRARITVLFQATRDRKVVEYCRKAGFGAVVELQPNQRHALADGVQVLCNPWRSGDSWLHFDSPSGTLLNLNDCIITRPEEMDQVLTEVGNRPIDVLATQFSLSAWEGNPEEVARRRAGAQFMLDKAVMQTVACRPRYVLPFASFVWFCHAENVYMNAEAVPIARAAAELGGRTGATPLVLYPGDRWQLGQPHDPASALARYQADLDAAAARAPVESRTIPEADLVAAAESFRQKLFEGSAPSRVRFAAAMSALRRARRDGGPIDQARALANALRARPAPARIWLSDHARAYTFDLEHGLRATDLPRAACDLELHSDSLGYALRFLWGGETLQVNGRFRELRPDGRFALLEYLWLAVDKNRGNHLRWSTLPRSLWRKAHARLPAGLREIVPG